MKDKFNRNIPDVNIGTIGRVDCSKEALKEAIQRVLGENSKKCNQHYDYINCETCEDEVISLRKSYKNIK